jgi:hypothetical protein
MDVPRKAHRSDPAKVGHRLDVVHAHGAICVLLNHFKIDASGAHEKRWARARSETEHAFADRHRYRRIEQNHRPHFQPWRYTLNYVTLPVSVGHVPRCPRLFDEIGLFRNPRPREIGLIAKKPRRDCLHPICG